MPLILPGNVGSATAATGFDVDNSVRFNSGSSPKMVKSSTAGNRTNWTFSAWFKRSGLGASQDIMASSGGASSSNYLYLQINGSDKMRFLDYSDGNNCNKITNRVFRDTGAWYHVVIAVDTTDGTAEDRFKLYINGVRETSFGTSANFSSSFATNMNVSGHSNAIGTNNQFNALYWDGYLAEIVLVDGTTLAPTDNIGEFDSDSGIWRPINVSGLTFGNNGFYLDFEASGNLGNDANGGGDFTETNLAAIDQTTDTCTNNFATLNPLFGGGVNLTLTEGNLNAEAEDGQPKNRVSTIAVSSGKWYAEFMSTAGTNYPGFGIMDVGSTLQTTVGYLGSTADSYCMFQGGLDYNGGTESDIGTAWGEDVIMGIGIDLDSGTKTIKYYKNGSEIHSRTISTPANGYVFAVTHSHDNTVSESNFGNPITALSSAAADGNGFGAFEFAPPSGYFALCTKNLAEHG